MKFLHTADWQLGMTRHFLPPEAQARYSDARTQAIVRLGEVAVDQGCEFILVCGDVFESNQLPAQIVARNLKAMGNIQLPVYLLPGNHDPLDASALYRQESFVAACPENVVVLETPGVAFVGTGKSGEPYRIVAAPWGSKAPDADLVRQALNEVEPVPDALTLVAGHGAVDVLSPNAADPAVIRISYLEQAVGSGALDYVALGDRHSTTDVGASGRLWYSGSPEVTDFRDTDAGNVLVVDIAMGAPASVSSVRVGCWVFDIITEDFSAANASAEIEALDQRLDAYASPQNAVLKLAFAGTLSVGQKAELDAVIQKHSDTFASLNFWERHHDLVVQTSRHDLDRANLSGFARDAAAELNGLAAEDGDDAQDAREALALLFRLTGGTK